MPLGDIQLSSNFSLSSQRPLDDRRTLDDIAERDALPFVRRYDLMRVDVIDTVQSFQLVLGTVDDDLFNNANWVETFGSMSPADYYTILQLQGDGTAEVHWNNLTNIPDFSTTFLELDDTEADYSGHAGEVPIVNEAEDALEFGVINSGFVTVGTGGDYATISEAIADSKYTLKLISDVTEVADIIINSRVYINLNNNTLDCVAFRFLGQTEDNILIIKNGYIIYTQPILARYLFGSSIYTYTKYVEFTINSTQRSGLGNGHFENGKITLPDTVNTGFGIYGSGFYGVIKNFEIVGTGSCRHAIVDAKPSSEIENILLSGSFTSTWDAIEIHSGNNIRVNTSSSTPRISIVGSVFNVQDLAGTPTLKIYLYSNALLASSNIGTLLLDKNGAKVTDTTIETASSVNADNISINGCTITTGTITIDATADKTILTNNRTATEIIDNGTNSIIQGNQLI